MKEDRPMPLTEHLAELRSRLLRCVIAIAVAFFLAWGFREQVFAILTWPVMEALRRHEVFTLQALQVTETITVYLKVAFVAALLLTSPYIAYQIWAFVAPGLYEHERHIVRLASGLVAGFFALGVLFCYFVFLPLVVDYLVVFTEASGLVRLVPTVEAVFSIVTLFPLVFGLLFQLPLIMFLLALLGIVNHKRFLKVSRYFVVFAFIIGAILTPPDPISQILLALPLTLLFFVGIAFAWVGDLLRSEGQKTVARVIATGAVLVFSGLIILAVITFNASPKRPFPNLSIPSDLSYVALIDVQSEPGRKLLPFLKLEAYEKTEGLEKLLVVSRLGREALLGLGEDLDCEAKGTACPLSGDELTLQEPQEEAPFSKAILTSQAHVVIGLSNTCLKKVLDDLQPLSPDTALVVTTISENYFCRMEASFYSPPQELLEGLTSLFDGPPKDEALLSSPLGLALSSLLADSELEVEEGKAKISFVGSKGRCLRALKAVLSGLQRCKEAQR